jgi:hypothetical protein
MNQLFSWRRKFRLWDYSVSYSQLLLRSVNLPDYETRIDVLFSNVRRVLLSYQYETLAVDSLEMGEVDNGLIGGGYEEWQRVFLINGGPDFIVASQCKWYEDVGDARTPSKFGPLRGTD